MIVSVHVHDDGDVELTKHEQKPQYLEDLCFDSVEAVRYELAVNYGIEEDRVLQALKELETEISVTI